MTINIDYEMNIPIVEVVTKHVILNDSFILANNIRLHLPWSYFIYLIIYLFNYPIKSNDQMKLFVSVIGVCIVMHLDGSYMHREVCIRRCEV